MTFEEWWKSSGPIPCKPRIGKPTPLKDLAETAYRAGLARAIEVCKAQEDALSEDGYTLINLGAGNCAKAIRAELDKQK